MEHVLFDTSVYISQLRRGNGDALGARRVSTNESLWLSSVVLAELYAGAGDAERRLVSRMEHDFVGVHRLLVPNLGDWTQCGQVLARLARRYDYEKIGRARLFNDALIAMSARRMGIRVLTANERDYARLAEIRSFQWQLIPG